jgi:hypothetical protein
MVCILAKGSGDCDHPKTVSIRLTAFLNPTDATGERPRSRASDPVISGCYHRINAETLMNRAVSAKAVSAPKTWCGRTT